MPNATYPFLSSPHSNGFFYISTRTCFDFCYSYAPRPLLANLSTGSFVRMRLNGYHCALGVLLSTTLLLLAFSTGSLISSLRSQYHTGLDRSLCKCELSRGHQDRRSIQPRIVNGTAFTSRHGLPWIASVYYHGPLKLVAALGIVVCIQVTRNLVVYSND